MAGKSNRSRVTSTLSGAWMKMTETQLDEAVLDMATDIHRGASLLAPELTSNLVQSGRVNRKGQAHYSVSFGNSQVPYAKLRHYVNRKNPQTLKYLERAGDSVSRGDVTRYMRGR